MISGYYRHPSINGERIVFVTEDDLWEVGTGGGPARRLTANPGPSAYPAFSPDGTRLAYIGRDEGVTEVHVMSDDGSRPRRLTFQGGLSQVVGWEGDNIVYASNAEWPFSNDTRLWSVPAAGGVPTLLAWGPARGYAREPGGPGVVLGRHTIDPARWKRYRGGRAGSLWIDRHGDGEFESLVDLAGNLGSPMWIGRRIYFISDHEGHGNVYSVTPTGRSLRRHTHHDQFYARGAATDGAGVVYHAGADLWFLDPGSDQPRRVDVTIPTARPHRNRRFISPGSYLESLDIHPEGHSLAATVRGSSYTMPLWEGAVRHHGPGSGVRRRLTSWMPDGERIAAISDETGEERLVVEPLGGGEPKRLDADFGRARSLDPAPAGSDRIAITNHRHELVVVTVSTGSTKVLYHSPYSWIAGTAWSGDGRWLAFSAATSRTTSALFLWDGAGRSRPRQITSGEAVDVWPSFDPGGRYLYFTSARVFDPVSDGHFHDYAFPQASRPHLVTLRADVASPFDPAQRSPRVLGAPPPGSPKPTKPADENGKNGKDGEPAQPEEVSVDLEGIEDRIVAFPQPSGRYGRVVGAKGRVFTVIHPIRGALSAGEKPEGRLEAWDFNAEKIEQIADGVSGVSTNSAGTVIAIRAGKKLRTVPVGWKDDKSAGSEPSRSSGWVNLERIRVQIDPGEEWGQMFSEAWRLQRDHYWLENMAGVDWLSVHDRYRPLVDRVGSRAEFSDLMWEMQGELGTSHAYELGGDYRPVPRYRQGSLGADLTVTRGRWVIEDILAGDTWERSDTSPLGLAGVDARPGDRLVAVDGVEVDNEASPYELLVDRGGRPVELTLKRGRRKPHTVVVTALADETKLRYRRWVESNRAAVRAATDGRAGYIHIPDMGPAGFAEFHRSLVTEVDHEGLVIDVRWNRGGNVSQLLLEKLARRRLGWQVTRWRDPSPVPTDAPAGPMVCLTNEMSGSDGDIFSHTFKLVGLGPLIGTRTWGGVVGIWPQQSLVDGTITTQPEFGSWFIDVGFGVENYGTDPDIEIPVAPQDHAAGRDPQLEAAVRELTGLMDSHETVEPDISAGPDLAAPSLER